MELTKTQKVSASMVGSNSLSGISAFCIVQDAVTEFMGELKIDGPTIKRKYNAFWVFVRTRIKFYKSLMWNDEYTVTAFISSKSLAKMNIDVEVRAGSDIALYGRVELCVLDIATQKIKKIATVGVDDTITTQQAREEITFSRLDNMELTFIEQIKVRSTNIDYSHHTNNVEYIRFILNTYSTRELEEKDIKEIEVAYLSQTYENDVLDVFKAKRSGKDYIALQCGGKPVVKCEIVF
ncbi:MAG: hypothetical protein J1F36_03300 [Clostridiales bacterium]|nr:hypothetical protein [Clostridiales bacterium]